MIIDTSSIPVVKHFITSDVSDRMFNANVIITRKKITADEADNWARTYNPEMIDNALFHRSMSASELKELTNEAKQSVAIGRIVFDSIKRSNDKHQCPSPSSVLDTGDVLLVVNIDFVEYAIEEPKTYVITYSLWNVLSTFNDKSTRYVSELRRQDNLTKYKTSKT